MPQSTPSESLSLPPTDGEKLEERYRSLIKSIDVGFCIIVVLFDEENKPFDYRFLETNPAFERNTGLTEVVGRTVLEMVPGHEDFWFETYGAVATTGVAVRFEDHAVALKRWFDVYAQRIDPPEKRELAVFFTDISARKEAEAALRRAGDRERERLTDIFLGAPAFMAALHGPTHIFELVNPPYLRLIGRPDARDSIIGKTVADVLPELAEQGFIALLDQVYRTGEAVVGSDTLVSFQRTEGGPMDEHFVTFTFQPILDDGEVTGILVHGVDLTERKHLEVERERLVADLRDASLRQRRFLKEMLAGFTEGRLRLCDDTDELPPALPLLADIVPLGESTLRPLRKTVEAAGREIRISRERLDEFITAVHEAGMNAVRYGGGGFAEVRGAEDAGALQVWLRDDGPGIAEELIHRAVEQGWTTGGFGQGFFLMRSFSDRLFLYTGDHGTTVVLEMERTPPKPAWVEGILKAGS